MMQSQINISCTLSIPGVQELVNDHFAGQPVGERLTIEFVELTADEERLNLKAYASGRYNGVVDTHFRLCIGDNDDLRIENLTIRLEGRNMLQKGANWLLSNVLGERIEAKLQSKIETTMRKIIRDLVSQYGNMQFGNGLIMSADISNFKFGNVEWDRQSIYCEVRSLAYIRLNFEHHKSQL